MQGIPETLTWPKMAADYTTICFTITRFSGYRVVTERPRLQDAACVAWNRIMKSMACGEQAR